MTYVEEGEEHSKDAIGATHEQDTNNPAFLREAVDAYSRIKKDHGEVDGINKYDHQAHILKVVSGLMDPNYSANFYLSSESMKVGGAGEKYSLNSYSYYYADVSSLDGNDGRSSSRHLNESTIHKMEEAGLLWKQTGNFVTEEKIKSPSYTAEQRLFLVKILLETETDLGEQQSGDESPIREQRKILEEAIAQAKNIDFAQTKESLLSGYKSKIDFTAKQLAKINGDPSHYSPRYTLEGVEYLSGPRAMALNKIKDRIGEISPIALQSEVDLEKLTDADLQGLHKVVEQIKQILSEKYQKEEFEFEDPPLEVGTRTHAKLNKEGEKSVLIIEKVPSTKLVSAKVEGDLAPHKRSMSKGESTLRLEQDTDKVGGFMSRITFPRDSTNLDEGQYAVELGVSSVGGHDWWTFIILTEEYLKNEKDEILAELKKNLPVRKMAKIISPHDGDYGVPVDELGNPCEEDRADHWRIYVTYRKWPNSYPDAYLLVPGAGNRSKRKASTFENLRKEYDR